ncbi:MAG TPA: FAD-dependent oxidoreductase [Dissulfurispiraceae bacterium]
MKHLVIGNGIAGTTAAFTIRKFDKESELVIISEEPYPFYRRTRLVDYLADEASENNLIVFKDDWYEKHRITLILNTRVISIEPASKEVVVSGNQRIRYDKLLLATGGAPFIPVLEGADTEGVFTMRTLDDAKRIKEYAKDRGDIVILGGGVLGIEMGSALRKAGKAVSIVESFPRLLPRQMDEEGAGILKDVLEDKGFRFHLNATAKKLLGDKAFEGLSLGGKRIVKGDMLVISTGSKANAALIGEAGIKPGLGVPVNDKMETEAPDIYAAGDLAEHRGRSYGLWQTAERQGEVAGINMAGGNAAYEGSLASYMVRTPDLELLSAGEIDAGGALEALVFKDREKGIYKKVVIENGYVTGCIFYGNTAGAKEILAAIRERKTLQEVRETIESLHPSASDN